MNITESARLFARSLRDEYKHRFIAVKMIVRGRPVIFDVDFGRGIVVDSKPGMVIMNVKIGMTQDDDFGIHVGPLPASPYLPRHRREEPSADLVLRPPSEARSDLNGDNWEEQQ